MLLGPVELKIGQLLYIPAISVINHFRWANNDRMLQNRFHIHNACINFYHNIHRLDYKSLLTFKHLFLFYSVHALSFPNLIMNNCFYLLPFLLECATGCHSTGMPVSAVKDGSECYCLKTVPTNHLLFPADDSCDVPCPGDQTKMCGGQQAWSFYITCRGQHIYYY